MPPTKITRSAKQAPKPAKPTFPVRKPALVKAADAVVAPINSGKVQAVYTRQGWLMWGIMGLCMAIGIFFWEQINSGFQWVRLEANERVYVDLGRETCKRPLMTIPEYTCTAGELDCFTVAQEAVIKRYEAQARAHNLWQAESCIPLM